MRALHLRYWTSTQKMTIYWKQKNKMKYRMSENERDSLHKKPHTHSFTYVHGNFI